MHGRLRIAEIPAGGAAAPEAPTFDLRHIQDFFWRRWKVIVATASVVAALAFVGTLAITPQYTATAHVLLEQNKDRVFGAESIVPELSLQSENVESQISVIKSLNLLRRVVEKTNLNTDVEFGLATSPGLFALVRSWFAFGGVKPSGIKGCNAAGRSDRGPSAL